MGLSLLAGAATARASGASDVNYSGYTDPWDALNNGGLSSSDANGLLLPRLSGYVGTDGASVGDFIPADATATDGTSIGEYLIARLGEAASAAGEAPTVGDIAASDSFAAGAIPFLGAGAGLALAGYAVYTVLFTDPSGGTHTVYVQFNRAQLGGASVVVPGNPYALNYDFKPTTNRTNNGFGHNPFGIVHFNQSGFNIWYLNYDMYIASNLDNNGNTLPYPEWSDQNVIGGRPTSDGFPGFPDYSWCENHGYIWQGQQQYGGPFPISPSCYGQGAPGAMKVGLGPALSQAGTQSVTTPVLGPLPVQVDTDAYASGHIFGSAGWSNYCSMSAPTPAGVEKCDLQYVNDTSFETLAPQTRTTGTPAEPSQGTVSKTQASCGTTCQQAIAAALGDSCGKALIDYILAPSKYPNPWKTGDCTSKTVNPGGSTVTVPSPPTTTTPAPAFVPFALPQPDPSQPYTTYLDELRSRGWTGTATATVLTTARSGLGPSAVSTITPNGEPVNDALAWPANPDTIQTADQAVALDVNPSTAPPVIAGGGSCACGPVDWSVFNGTDFGGRLPFGFFTWMGGLFGSLSTSAVAPSWDITKPSALGGGTIHVDMSNSDWESTWRPIAFPIIEFVITVAAFWFVCVKVLGFGSEPLEDE